MVSQFIKGYFTEMLSSMNVDAHRNKNRRYSNQIE